MLVGLLWVDFVVVLVVECLGYLVVYCGQCVVGQCGYMEVVDDEFGVGQQFGCVDC